MLLLITKLQVSRNNVAVFGSLIETKKAVNWKHSCAITISTAVGLLYVTKCDYLVSLKKTKKKKIASTSNVFQQKILWVFHFTDS